MWPSGGKGITLPRNKPTVLVLCLSVLFATWQHPAISHILLSQMWINRHGRDVVACVVLLILTSQPIDALTMLGDGRQSKDVHGSPPTYIEWIILVYVIGRQTVGLVDKGVIYLGSAIDTRKDRNKKKTNCQKQYDVFLTLGWRFGLVVTRWLRST